MRTLGRAELVLEIQLGLRRQLNADDFPEIASVGPDVTGNVVLVQQKDGPTWGVIVVEVPRLHVIEEPVDADVAASGGDVE